MHDRLHVDSVTISSVANRTTNTWSWVSLDCSKNLRGRIFLLASRNGSETKRKSIRKSARSYINCQSSYLAVTVSEVRYAADWSRRLKIARFKDMLYTWAPTTETSFRLTILEAYTQGFPFSWRKSGQPILYLPMTNKLLLYSGIERSIWKSLSQPEM